MKELMKQQFTYKNPDTLRKFITPYGSILPRSKTGLSAKEQKKLSKEIKRARHLALLPFTQTM